MDITHEKFARLMDEIRVLEAKVNGFLDSDADNPELKKTAEELAAKRNELARISDGCGRPHPQQ